MVASSCLAYARLTILTRFTLDRHLAREVTLPVITDYDHGLGGRDIVPKNVAGLFEVGPDPEAQGHGSEGGREGEAAAHHLGLPSSTRLQISTHGLQLVEDLLIRQ